jgi:hypothetical protein
MESALECNQRAAECERLAGTTISEPARHVMKAAAEQWRKLAEEAVKRERLAALASPVTMTVGLETPPAMPSPPTIGPVDPEEKPKH